MALRMRDELEDAVVLIVAASGAKTQGQSDIVNGKPGFWHAAVADTELGSFITEAPMVLADVDSAGTYNAGDVLYEHATVPTGVLNKTATARTKVGYVLKSYPANTSQVLMRYTGGLN